MEKQHSLFIAIICIIGAEFWERFSFCGLRTILSLYLRNQLGLSEGSATLVYHVFIMICYIIPIVGAICADSFLGRYRTIFYFLIIYIIGNVLMIFAAIPTIALSPALTTIFGLTLIAAGTGGTKPCLAAFGGDQFHLPVQRDKLQQFFSLFYFAINLGGFVGMILTPILRKSTSCFGDDTCYAVGFGFPAVLMMLSFVLFFLGKPFYRIKQPKGNVVIDFVKCTAYGVSQRIKNRKKHREEFDHWLDCCKGRYPKKLVYDLKVLYAVLFIYIPLPIFWSLFDQQGSRWTFQASRMNGYVLGVLVLPDQMQVINPGIVLILIPFFDKCLYPLLSRYDILTNHLHRMAVGGLVAGVAFMCAGMLELVLEQNYPQLPRHHHAAINFINTLPCDVNVTNPFNGLVHIRSGDKFLFQDIRAHNVTRYNITVRISSGCPPYGNYARMRIPLAAYELQVDTMLLCYDGNYQLVPYVSDPFEFRRSLSGRPRIRILFIKRSRFISNITLTFVGIAGLTDIYFLPDSVEFLVHSDYIELPADGYIYKVSGENIVYYENEIHLAMGGIYTLVIMERNHFIEFAKLYVMSPPNDINIMWLIPQYFFISVSEIMFGIAGLEFSFTQAPKTMKTVMIAAWYLSVAVGNLFVIIITQANLFRSQAHEFFLFAILIIGDMILFTHLSSHYNYVELEADSSAFMLEKKPLFDEDDEDNDREAASSGNNS